MTTLGKKIRSLRKDRRMTLDALADAADMSKSYIWELENRESPNPSAEKLGALAKCLDVTIEFLLEDSRAAPEEQVHDQVFFRKYQDLDPEAKKRLQQIVDAFRQTP